METHTLPSDGERYELLGELASGGMATVYLARMRRPMGFSRLVAIKCMHPQFAKDPSFVSMFLDEARLTARLRHPNIVPTLDIVAEDGHLLLVMDYVEGVSLAHLLRSASRANVRVPTPIVCAIIHDLLLGLHEAHQAKDDDGAPLAIVHRDVSPQNVIVGVDGLARVLDFGVAKARQNTHHSNDNEIKGKIPYMPPEQLFGEGIDHRVDVYAAGVSLWEALVCERLFDGPSETALVKKISEQPIALPSSRVAELPPKLDAVVMRALARDPKARFESALAMAEALAEVVPLPTRTEVSAWVRQYVTPREIPSGTKLPMVKQEDPATTILAILQKASMLRPSAKRPAPTMRPARTTRYAAGAAAVALVFAAVAVARVTKSEAAIARVATAATPAVQTTEAAHVTPAPTAETTDTAEVVPRRAEPEPPPVAVAVPAHAPKLAQPVTRVAYAPKIQAQPAPADKSKDCAIPFTIDENGHKHYKVECVR
jgi:serine/threonine-protein kinase